MTGGSIIGLLLGQVGGSGQLGGLVGGLVFALILALFTMLVGGLSVVQINEDKRVRPNQGIHSSGRNALHISLIAMLVGTLYGLSGDLIGMLIATLVLGLLSGLLFGGTPYLQHYILRYILWRNGAIPWWYVKFLEDTTARILLRRVDGGYSFPHRLFLDYFADLPQETPSGSGRN